MREKVWVEGVFSTPEQCRQFVDEHGIPREWQDGQRISLHVHGRPLIEGRRRINTDRLGCVRAILSHGENGNCRVVMVRNAIRTELDRNTLYAINHHRDPVERDGRFLATVLLLSALCPVRAMDWLTEHLAPARVLIEYWRRSRPSRLTIVAAGRLA